MTKRHTNNGLDDTRRFFEELKISGWIFVPDSKIWPGKQARVCRVDSKDGLMKAFCKFLPANPSDKKIERFRREISILCNEAVAGPGIVQLYDYDRGSEPRWYVTEFGTPFEQYWKKIRRNTSPEELVHQAATICSQLAGALSRCHEHENEYFHRDIKPDNIVTRE